jgi:hypothetical protein
MSKKQDKRLRVLGGIVGGLFLLVLEGQAILRISSGDFVGGTNYMGQPVGPVIQLIVVFVCMIVIGVTGWRHLRSTPEQHKKKGTQRQPEWLKQPPYKFPWE